MNIHSFLEHHAISRPTDRAVKFEDQVYTFQKWNEDANRLAHSLIARGVKKGDHVAIMFNNTYGFFVSFIAALKTGAVCVPINFRLTKPELQFILNNSDSKVLILQENYFPLIQELQGSLPELEQVIVDTKEAVAAPYVTMRDAMADQPVSDPGIAVDESDWAEILYTSGTTGKPKGAILTHHSIIWSGLNMIMLTQLNKKDHLIHAAPLFHCGQLNLWMISGLIVGCYNVIVEFFHPVRCLETIQNDQISLFHGPPTMFQLMTAVPNFAEYDLSSLKRCTYGGASMTPTANLEMVKNFSASGCSDFYNLTGMTEMGPSGIVLYPHEHLTKPGMSGKIPMASTLVRVVDSEGNDVKPGQVGEFILHGETMMQGYYKRPEATQEVIRDGWYYSGDLAYVDEDGYIRIVDRIRDMVITGAENVYTLEIENALSEHPGVADSTVFGVPNELWGEVVMALIVPRAGHTLIEPEIQDFCRRRLAGYKIPRIIRFVEAIQRNSAGKVLKRDLREKYKDAGQDYKGPGKYAEQT